jgi:ABC-type polysaccharide/polyol phosphate export permease
MKWTSANYAANIVSAIHAPTPTQRYTPFIYKLDLLSLVLNEIVTYAPITRIAMDLHTISLYARSDVRMYVYIYVKLTAFMELSPFWEDSNRSSIQEVSSFCGTV